MARQYAPIHLSIWNAGSNFRDLTVEAQHVYFLAFSQPRMTYCGVVPYQPRMWATLATNGTAAKVKKAVAELITKGYVVVDNDTEELWVRSFVKHNKILEQAQLHKSMNESYEHISSMAIKRAFYATLPESAQRQLKPPSPAESPPPCPPPSPGSDGKGTGVLTGSSGFDLDLDAGPSPEPSPGPEPGPMTTTVPASPNGTGEAGAPATEIEIHNAFERRVFSWVDRSMDTFGFDAKQHLRLGHIFRLVCAAVDDRLIEQAIGYCACLREPVASPKFLEVTLGEWAKQREILIPGLAERAS